MLSLGFRLMNQVFLLTSGKNTIFFEISSRYYPKYCKFPDNISNIVFYTSDTICSKCQGNKFGAKIWKQHVKRTNCISDLSVGELVNKVVLSEIHNSLLLSFQGKVAKYCKYLYEAHRCQTIRKVFCTQIKLAFIECKNYATVIKMF